MKFWKYLNLKLIQNIIKLILNRKTGKRRKSVEKDSDGMDNISDFFGEDESDDESEDPDDKDELDTIDGYSNNGETTDGIDESNDNSEKNEENLNNNVENSENEIKEPFLIQSKCIFNYCKVFYNIYLR